MFRKFKKLNPKSSLLLPKWWNLNQVFKTFKYEKSLLILDFFRRNWTGQGVANWHVFLPFASGRRTKSPTTATTSQKILKSLKTNPFFDSCKNEYEYASSRKKLSEILILWIMIIALKQLKCKWNMTMASFTITSAFEPKIFVTMTSSSWTWPNSSSTSQLVMMEKN